MTAPTPSATAGPYFEGLNEGVLRYQYCEICARAQHYPREHCVSCGSRELQWRESAGLGEIYSFTVVERAPTPAFRELVPYILALVDLDEGFRLMLNIPGVPTSSVSIGTRVEIYFPESPADGEILVQARPIE